MTPEEKTTLLKQLIALRDKAESDAWVKADNSMPIGAAVCDGKAEAYATVIKLIEDM